MQSQVSLPVTVVIFILVVAILVGAYFALTAKDAGSEPANGPVATTIQAPGNPGGVVLFIYIMPLTPDTLETI